MSSVSVVSPDGRSAVCGGARLRYAANQAGETRLAEQWVRPPLHMTKVYADKGWAISQMMSPTAGLLSGDILEVSARVGPQARVALLSPAACRVHQMDVGHAEIRQNYTVEAGGVLDVWPAPLILQRGASLSQETRLDLVEAATVLLCEIITPGRASFGEHFEFRQWCSRLKIYQSGKLLSYENFSVSPALGDVADWRQQYPSGSYAGLYYLTSEPLGELVQQIHDLDIEMASVGASPLRSGGLGLKVLAADGISLRKAIFALRQLLVAHSRVSFPSSLRRAQTFFH